MLFAIADPTAFPGVLSYLRTRKVVFSPTNDDDTYLQLLLIEADFYQYEDLSRAIVSELQERSNEIDRKQSLEMNSSSNISYRIVREAEASFWFDRGWSFVSQYYGDECRACPAGNSYLAAHIDANRKCSVCQESILGRSFGNHTVIFKPCMFVLSKKWPQRTSSSRSAGDRVDGVVEVDSGAGLQFDQSFG